MKRFIYLREVLAIISNKKIKNVDTPTATVRIRSILMEAEGFSYNPQKSIQKNILDFYAERGFPNMWDVCRRFSSFYTEGVSEGLIARIITKKRAPECLEVSIRKNNQNTETQVSPVPVIWKKTDYGTENAFCTHCGKQLYSTISLLSPSIRGYDECDCRKSS